MVMQSFLGGFLWMIDSMIFLPGGQADGCILDQTHIEQTRGDAIVVSILHHSGTGLQGEWSKERNTKKRIA